MSGSLHAWYSLRDLEALGARRAVFGGELELATLSRLAGLLAADEGSVKATLTFGQRSDGWLTVDVAYAADAQLLCQRCLEPVTEHIAGQVSLAVLDSVSADSQLPDGYEPLELEDGRLSPAQVIEDELIVSLPLVPKHARVEDCGSLSRVLTRPRERDDAAGDATDR
jgi:DUF177 domain-containing protein